MLAILLGVGCPSGAAAQASAPRDAGQAAAAQERSRRPLADSAPGMTKAREAAALAFVREHHPQLEQLLIQLGESQPRQYEAAIRDLFRTSERLAGLHERDPARYELELKAWKLNSRAQLLSATLLMTPADKDLRARLKQTLLHHARARRELLVLERQRATRRLEKIESQIESIDRGAERMAERRIKLLLEPPADGGVKTSTSDQ